VRFLGIVLVWRTWLSHCGHELFARTR